ncbi:MAG: iron-containing redox enzyme family protein [Pseudoruegeria sp.]
MRDLHTNEDLHQPFPTLGGDDTARSLYWQALDIETYPDCPNQLLAVLSEILPDGSTAEAELFEQPGELESLRATALIQPLHAPALNPDLFPDRDRQQFALLQLAPLMRLEGAQLSGAIQLRTAGLSSGAALLRMHERISGAGDLNASRPWVFAQELAAGGITLPALHDAGFAFDYRIGESAFQLPLFLLALAQFPGQYYAQTLGVNLFLAQACPASFLPETTPYTKLFKSHLTDDIQDARAAILLAKGSDTRLIEQGFFAARRIYQIFLDQLVLDLRNGNRFTATGKFLSLLTRLGSAPFGYHKKGKMGGEPIDHWFDPQRLDPGRTLQALARSPYVLPGQPDKSRFLTQLTEPNGPMFRIFSDADLQVIRNWIQALPHSREVDLAGITLPAPLPAPTPRPAVTLAASKAGFDLREMYYRLLNIDKFPKERCTAGAYARDWLKAHERRAVALPFDVYSHADLDLWLEKQHAEQVASYQPLVDYPEEAREEVVHMAVQLAPLTRIDGAWLRAFTAPEHVNTKVGGLLYHIYADELGNGDIALHHGNIYRDLVASMGYDLADFSEREFAFDPVFTDNAFEVPVFWLSISLFPRRFMPEILGLNLAMELSGIGGEYRRSGDVLAHYGYSAQFTILHNSIDNIITGHTAWAINAIKAHMDEVGMRSGAAGLAAHWQRVWTGYRALHPPQRRPLLIEALSRLFQ